MYAFLCHVIYIYIIHLIYIYIIMLSRILLKNITVFLFSYIEKNKISLNTFNFRDFI